MLPAKSIRGWILSLELRFLCHARLLRRALALCRLRHSVTADLKILDTTKDGAFAFTIDFRSPYFRLPVPLEKSQIGEMAADHGLRPASFRFFDWQTWEHIEGSIEWHGERRVPVDGKDVEFITGFTYRVPGIPEGKGNLGLRLAEGVEGTVRVACGERVARVQFEPIFWLLEATGTRQRPVPIRSTKLMGLIVPLFDLGRGAPQARDHAVDRLQEWAEMNLNDAKPFQDVLPFLTYLRDWAPLGMDPMFPGIALVLERLQVQEPERHLFDFFADNWGVRSNRNGRILAVRLLEALGTQGALAALHAISALVENQPISPEEGDLIRAASATLSTKHTSFSER